MMRGIRSFEIWPNKLIFGANAIDQLGGELALLRVGRPILVTDRGLCDTPVCKRIVGLIAEAGFTDVPVFSDVDTNPTEDAVDALVALMREHNADSLVAVGGGSAMDCARIANVLATHGGSVPDFYPLGRERIKIEPKLLPWITVPTTAGTGAELSRAGVITARGEKRKMNVISPFLIPPAAIVDPTLTVSLPPFFTAATGMDALTHAIEAYVSTVGFPPAEAIALRAIQMIARNLPVVVANGQDLPAREQMMMASTMAVLAFAHNLLGLVHGCAHQLGALYNLHHGLTNSLMLPYVMEYNLPAAMQKYADIAAAMGEPTAGLSVREAARRAVGAVRQLVADVALPARLSQVGVDERDIPTLAEMAMKDVVIGTNPRTPTTAEVAELYRRAF